MKSKKNIEISETQSEEQQFVEVIDQKKNPEPVKPKKKVFSESELEALAKARVKAQERKQELKELNYKSKSLKEQQEK
jgi:hypothetical protein